MGLSSSKQRSVAPQAIRANVLSQAQKEEMNGLWQRGHLLILNAGKYPYKELKRAAEELGKTVERCSTRDRGDYFYLTGELGQASLYAVVQNLQLYITKNSEDFLFRRKAYLQKQLADKVSEFGKQRDVFRRVISAKQVGDPTINIFKTILTSAKEIVKTFKKEFPNHDKEEIQSKLDSMQEEVTALQKLRDTALNSIISGGGVLDISMESAASGRSERSDSYASRDSYASSGVSSIQSLMFCTELPGRSVDAGSSDNLAALEAEFSKIPSGDVGQSPMMKPVTTGKGVN